MNKRVRSLLIELCRKRQGGYIHYQELSDQCKLGLNMRDNPQDRSEIGRILGEISVYENFNERPLLSSIVITKSGEEGDGFFKLCEDLRMGDWKRLKSDPAFQSIQMNRCYEFWQDDNKYRQFKDI